jgi:hypothetical protein
MLVLAKSGLAVVKEPGSFLSVDAGFHERAHKHSDELSFDLFDRGHRVVSDTGMYQKDPGKIRNFVRSARAHSTLTVDRRDFPRSARYAYGSGLKAAGTGAGWYAIQARNPLLRRQAVLHTRLFLYKPGVALIVVDRVRSPNKHSYDRYFQLGPHVDIQPEDPNELRLEAAGLHASLYSESSVGRERRSNVRGSRKPLAGWTSPSYRDLTPRWTVDLRSAAADADYVTTIGLDSSRLHATLGSVGLSRTSLNLASYAVPAGTLTVRRDGSRLTVTQAGA